MFLTKEELGIITKKCENGDIDWLKSFEDKYKDAGIEYYNKIGQLSKYPNIRNFTVKTITNMVITVIEKTSPQSNYITALTNTTILATACQCGGDMCNHNRCAIYLQDELSFNEIMNIIYRMILNQNRNINQNWKLIPDDVIDAFKMVDIRLSVESKKSDNCNLKKSLDDHSSYLRNINEELEDHIHPKIDINYSRLDFHQDKLNKQQSIIENLKAEMESMKEQSKAEILMLKNMLHKQDDFIRESKEEMISIVSELKLSKKNSYFDNDYVKNVIIIPNYDYVLIKARKQLMHNELKVVYKFFKRSINTTYLPMAIPIKEL
jgi:hypothetical protein